MFKLFIFSTLILALGAYYGQVQAAVLPVSSTEVALVRSSASTTSSSETSIDTLGSSRVKRQGGCGCCGCGCGCCGCGGGGGGCGCCCCRPRCCCCCRRCCTCCRTCCCTRCCTCCRPCCCGCGCGCGCCGCGGGGRKRRSLQNLRIDEANRALGIKRRPTKGGDNC
ncbi:Intrinsically Disordered Protein, class B [Caenorhabditis elegans]|uniref:Intrinsically Disordered Protein, class B n=1 Tax=Caenorhabditis elegans TaxID=6239 RepID=Q95QY1_CAEEL|nr:Intrinsically Disordered Protein, class B [Caenorhabditis elegans]CCD63057.1 Intrinsically Disordered Protein, class B [Caenorhabditis elegans]|eukprot:NP_494944.1 Uncharacterized protein CELE_C04G6.10 [Caenorhabditis elegans]